MKGIVFTEFIDMVEQRFGYQMVDELLTETNLPSGGAYTAIGTYSHQEMVDLVLGLSKKTSTPYSQLLYSFGQHLFKTFIKTYGHFVEHVTSAFSFLESIDSHIHVEVKKLYPDAQFPNFQVNKVTGNMLELTYRSDRAMGDLAEGLIASSIDFFNEKASIKRILLSEDGKAELFIITKE